MALPLNFPDKHPQEIFINGADWSRLMGGATIVSVAASVEDGDVSVTTPQASAFSGAIQSVWVTGGTQAAGEQRIRLEATFSDGRVLAQDFIFKVVT